MKSRFFFNTPDQRVVTSDNSVRFCDRFEVFLKDWTAKVVKVHDKNTKCSVEVSHHWFDGKHFQVDVINSFLM